MKNQSSIIDEGIYRIKNIPPHKITALKNAIGSNDAGGQKSSSRENPFESLGKWENTR